MFVQNVKTHFAKQPLNSFWKVRVSGRLLKDCGAAVETVNKMASASQAGEEILHQAKERLNMNS